MEQFTDKTLAQIQVALAAIDAERAIPGLSDSEIQKLEAAFIKLRNLERNVVNEITDELIKALKNDSKALLALVEEINQLSQRLGNISLTIKKAANAVDALIDIISIATKVGLL